MMKSCRLLLETIIFLCVCLVNICYAGSVVDPISNDSAEVFGLKVGIDMTKDTENCGEVDPVLHMEEFDRVTDAGNLLGFASRHTNNGHVAMMVYHENMDKHLVSVMVMPADSSKETYVKAVVPVLIYSLLNIGLDLKEVQSLMLRSMVEDMVAVNGKAINKKIVLYKMSHEGNDTLPTYHIMTI